MTKETPGQIMTLLGVAMVSMFMMFTVSATNASFTQVENPFPDPFAPEKIVAMLDSVSNSYSQFLAANLFEPAKADLAFYNDNAQWVIDESADSVLGIVGLRELASVEYYQNLDRAQRAPQVAGAYTQSEYENGGGFSIDSLYSMLVR
jgi:hypothetical protein